MSKIDTGWVWKEGQYSTIYKEAITICKWCSKHNEKLSRIPRGVTLSQVEQGVCHVCNHEFREE
jgi:hypothetical protein